MDKQGVIDKITELYATLDGARADISINEDADSRIEIAVHYEKEGESMVSAFYITEDLIKNCDRMEDLIDARFNLDKAEIEGD